MGSEILSHESQLDCSLLEFLPAVCINDLLTCAHLTEFFVLLCEICKLKFKCLFMTCQVLGTQSMSHSAASFHTLLHLCGPVLFLLCAPVHQICQINSCHCAFALVNSDLNAFPPIFQSARTYSLVNFLFNQVNTYLIIYGNMGTCSTGKLETKSHKMPKIQIHRAILTYQNKHLEQGLGICI